MMLIFVHYIAYICEVSHYEKQRLFLLIANLLFAVVMLVDIIVTAQGITFSIDETGISFVRRGIFIYGFLGFIILCVILMTRVRRLLFHRVMLGFYGTIVISVFVLVIQSVCSQSSFTVATLLFPVVAMMYVLHSNPYDALIGTNDINAMQDFVKYCCERKQDFIFMSLYMKEFDEGGKELSEELQTEIRQFRYALAKKAKLFKVSKGHFILMFRKSIFRTMRRG